MTETQNDLCRVWLRAEEMQLQ